jgi:Mrp family chromosome partitioning ATPase
MSETSWRRDWPKLANPLPVLDVAGLEAVERSDPAERRGRAVTRPARELPTRWARREVLESCGLALHRMGGTTLGSVGVTSTVRGEGRSTVAVAMAAVQRYEYDRRTILLELDLDKPSAASRLSVAPSPGVSEFVGEGVEIESCLQTLDNDFDVMTAGHVGDASASLLVGTVAENLISELRGRCDVLIIDLPPLTPQVLGAQLADLCAAVAVVVRAGSVTPRQIQLAADTIAVRPSMILNGVESAEPSWIRRVFGITG